MNYISGFDRKIFRWRRYGVAVLAVTSALLLKLLLSPLFEQESPFLLFFAAVMVSAWYGGMGAGVLAIAASTLVSNYFFISPTYSFIDRNFGQNLGLILFVLEGISISSVVAALNSAKRQAKMSSLKTQHHLETLRESEERFRLLVEEVKDYGIFMLDTDGRVASWNAGAERIFGYQEAEIIGQHFSCIFTPEDIHDRCPEQELKTAVAFGRADDERWHIRSDGTSFWASGVLTALQDSAGNLKGFSQVVRDFTEHKRVTDQIKASLREKEVLLKEIHHRVKNNLQIISSLLNLQSGAIEDSLTLEILKAGENRVASMALIHEQLYQSEDLASIDFADYIQSLMVNLFSSYDIDSEKIALKINVEHIYLSVDAAIPCGLIINEVVSNSLKHAFTLGKSVGEICINFHLENEKQLSLRISDNGIGFPPSLDYKNTESLGLQLVNVLTEQLSGTLVLNRSIGTEFKINFPFKNLYK